MDGWAHGLEKIHGGVLAGRPDRRGRAVRAATTFRREFRPAPGPGTRGAAGWGTGNGEEEAGGAKGLPIDLPGRLRPRLFLPPRARQSILHGFARVRQTNPPMSRVVGGAASPRRLVRPSDPAVPGRGVRVLVPVVTDLPLVEHTPERRGFVKSGFRFPAGVPWPRIPCAVRPVPASAARRRVGLDRAARDVLEGRSSAPGAGRAGEVRSRTQGAIACETCWLFWPP
jgi:hypothetical protein